HHAEQTGHPHPEQRTGSADADGGGHTDDVAGADRRRERRRQRLELRDVALGSGVLALEDAQVQRRQQFGELQTAEADRQIEARAQQQGNEQERTPDESADRIEELGDRIHVVTSLSNAGARRDSDHCSERFLTVPHEYPERTTFILRLSCARSANPRARVQPPLVRGFTDPRPRSPPLLRAGSQRPTRSRALPTIEAASMPWMAWACLTEEA